MPLSFRKEERRMNRPQTGSLSERRTGLLSERRLHLAYISRQPRRPAGLHLARDVVPRVGRGRRRGPLRSAASLRFGNRRTVAHLLLPGRCLLASVIPTAAG